jgi:hypothetical protein
MGRQIILPSLNRGRTVMLNKRARKALAEGRVTRLVRPVNAMPAPTDHYPVGHLRDLEPPHEEDDE